MMQLVVYGPPSFYIVTEAIGERPTSLIAVAVALIISLCDVYMQGNNAVLITCLIATFLGVLVFSLAAPADHPPSTHDLTMSKLFVVVSEFSDSIRICIHMMSVCPYPDKPIPQVITRE